MTVLEALTEIALRHLPLSRQAALEPDADLETLGLDSLAFAAFLIDVEQTFDVIFPAEAIHRETFRTLRITAASIKTIRGG